MALTKFYCPVHGYLLATSAASARVFCGKRLGGPKNPKCNKKATTTPTKGAV